MWKFFGKEFNVVVFLIASSILFYPLPARAIPPLSDGDAKNIVESGRENDYKFIIPVGTIWLNTNENNPKEHKYGSKHVKTIEGWETLDLITKKEERNVNPNFGFSAKQYNVSITQKGEKLSSGRMPNGDYIIKLADIKVSKVVKNAEYKTPLANPDEELRIVMGVYNFNPTTIGKEFYSKLQQTNLEGQYKFRALLKYDPFQSKYVYVLCDWGFMNKNNFETNKIENYNFPLR